MADDSIVVIRKEDFSGLADPKTLRIAYRHFRDWSGLQEPHRVATTRHGYDISSGIHSQYALAEAACDIHEAVGRGNNICWFPQLCTPGSSLRRRRRQAIPNDCFDHLAGGTDSSDSVVFCNDELAGRIDRQVGRGADIGKTSI